MADPSGWISRLCAATDVPNPPTGKVHLFFDVADGQPKYKTSAGVVNTFPSVTMVAGLTGNVTTAQLIAALDPSFLTQAEGDARYLQLSLAAEFVQDTVGAFVTDSASIDFTYDDAGNTLTATAIPAGINHNALQNYVASQHVDHSSVSVIAGNGLTGGGTIAADRTLNVAANDSSITVTADGINVGVISDTQHGSRAGGTLHAIATPNTLAGFAGTGGISGFISAAFQTSLSNWFFGGGIFNIKDYGAIANDSLGAGGFDNSPAIQAAINAAAAAGGGIVFTPAGNFSQFTGVVVNDPCVGFMGAGCGYTADVGDYRTQLGSCWSWRGAAGGIMLDVFPRSGATVNPIFGFRWQGMSLDGRDLQPGPTDTGATPPAIGIRMRACAGAHLSDFYLNGPFTTTALDLGTLAPGTIGGVDSHGVVRSIFERFCIRQLDGAAPGIGLRCFGSASANVNFCKFDTFQIMYRSDSVRQPAIQLANTDSNTFFMGACNRSGGSSLNWGIEILGSNVSAAEVSRANIFYHCSPGPNGAFLAGTGLGRNPAGTADASLNFTFPSTDNQFRPQSTENGEPVPVFGTAATGGYGITGGSTGSRFWGEGSTLASRSTPTAAITTAETSMLSFVAPANFLKVGTVIEFAASGISTNTTAAATYTARGKVGAANVAQNAIGGGTLARTNTAAFVTGQFLVTAAGAAGAAIGQMTIVLAPQVGTGVTAPTAGITVAVAINTTIINTIDFTIASSAATSSITIHSAVIRLANQ